jgi:radical SAM protein with 4Fe4S-binding SPASM domain
MKRLKELTLLVSNGTCSTGRRKLLDTVRLSVSIDSSEKSHIISSRTENPYEARTMATNKPLEFFIQWHLTEKCNLRCRHCYQDEAGSTELPLADIRRTAAEAEDLISEWSAAYGIVFRRSMNLTGGEPLLRHDLFSVIEDVKNRGFEVHLLTNGTLVDRQRAERLAALGVDGVQVSIEGPEELHDAIRGAGSFAASAAGIKRLAGCGLAVTLNITLSRFNAGHMDRVIAFASHSGARRIGFSRLVPAGRGRTMINEMLSREELAPLYAALLERELLGIELVTGDPMAGQLRNKDFAKSGDAGDIAVSGCAAGISGLTIQSNGNLLPCRRLPVSLGNVQRDSLREVWAVSPVLEALRERKGYKGRCGSCSRWSVCRGCRAIAFAWSRAHGGGDFLADDPQCFLEGRFASFEDKEQLR